MCKSKPAYAVNKTCCCCPLLTLNILLNCLKSPGQLWSELVVFLWEFILQLLYRWFFYMCAVLIFLSSVHMKSYFIMLSTLCMLIRFLFSSFDHVIGFWCLCMSFCFDVSVFLPIFNRNWHYCLRWCTSTLIIFFNKARF